MSAAATAAVIPIIPEIQLKRILYATDFSEGSQAPPRLPLASRFGPRPQSVGGRPAQVQSSSLQSNWQEGKRRWEGYRTKKIRSAETPQVSALRSHALAP